MIERLMEFADEAERAASGAYRVDDGLEVCQVQRAWFDRLSYLLREAAEALR